VTPVSKSYKTSFNPVLNAKRLNQLVTHVDGSRVSKAIICISVSVCDSVCLSVCLSAR